MKRSAVASLPDNSCKKYDGEIAVKANKIADIKKIVTKYVPAQHKAYYSSIQHEQSRRSSAEETDESDD